MPDGPPRLAAIYRRLAALCPTLTVRFTRSDDTAETVTEFTPKAYADRHTLDEGRPAGRVDALIDGESDRVLAAHGVRPRRDVAASRLLHHLLWSGGLLLTGPWYLTGRVPRIPPGSLTADPATGTLHLDPHGLDHGPPGGPGPVRAAVGETLTPLLDAFAPHLRRGRRALYGMLTDDLASGLWHLGRAGGDEPSGVRAAERLLPGGTAPFTSPAAFRTLPGTHGRPHTTRTRTACCLYYAISPGDPCLTCPRLTDAERVRRLEEA